MKVIEETDTDPLTEEIFHTPQVSPVEKKNEPQKSDTSFIIDHFDDKSPISEGISEAKEESETVDGDINTLSGSNQQPPLRKRRLASNETKGNTLQETAQDIPLNTRNNTLWCANIWKAWANWRNRITDASLVDSSYQTVPSDPRDATEKEFGFWLARFVIEVRNSKGEYYPPNSLLNLLYSIQRYCNIRSDGLATELKIFDLTNPNFNEFQQACEKVMEELTLQGVGKDVKKADIITEDDEDKLWSSGAINLITPRGLLYGVYFYNVRAFGLQGENVHRDLTRNQFCIEYDSQLGVEKLQYIEKLTTPKEKETCLSRLKAPNPKSPLKPEILAQADNPRCIVNLFKIYLSQIPDIGPFYFHPSRNKKNDDAYSMKPVGINFFRRFFTEMYQIAGIDLSGRHISGRSGRLTISYKLLSQGYKKSSVNGVNVVCPPQSSYLQAFIPRDETTSVAVSDVLQAKRPVIDKDDKNLKSSVKEPCPPQSSYSQSFIPRDETTSVAVSDVLQAKRPVNDKDDKDLKSSVKEPCPPQLNYLQSFKPRDETISVAVSDVLQAKRPVNDKDDNFGDEMPPLRPIQMNNSLRPSQMMNGSTPIQANNSSGPTEIMVIKEEEC